MTRNGVGRCFTRLLDQGQILFFFFSPGRFVLNFASRASFFQCFFLLRYTPSFLLHNPPSLSLSISLSLSLLPFSPLATV